MIKEAHFDLICALGYLYLARGQNKRAVAVLQFAYDAGPEDIRILRLLVYALIVTGNGSKALERIDDLEHLETDPATRPLLALLRSRALHQQMRMEEAREFFSEFLALKSEMGHVGLNA